MGFKPMNQDTARMMIEGQVDVLEEARREEQRIYRDCLCPNCSERGATKIIPDPEIIIGEDGRPVVLRSPFSEDYPLPHGYAHCKNCGTDYNPLTGIIRKSPSSMTRVEHEDLLLLQQSNWKF